MYSLRNDVIDREALEQQLAVMAFQPCTAQSMATSGWVPVLGEMLAFAQGNHFLLQWQREEKILPSTVVKEEVAKRVEKIEAEQQRRLKKTERDSLKDETLHTLLPRAFTRKKQAYLWIDLEQNRIVVGVSSAKQAEDILALLRKSIGSLPTIPFALESPIELTVSEWIKEEMMPPKFTGGDSVKVVSLIEAGSAATFAKSDIFSEQVQTSLADGKLVTSMGLEWNERITFKLSDTLALTGIHYSDMLVQQNDDIDREDEAARFDADFLLFRGEFSGLFNELVDALGGEAHV